MRQNYVRSFTPTHFGLRVVFWASIYAIPSAQQSMSWPFELVYQFGKWGWKSYAGTQNLYVQLAWCYGNLPLQHTSAHGGHFWPSSLVAMGAYQTVQDREFIIPLMLRTKRRASWLLIDCLQNEDSWGWDYERTWNYLLQSARCHGNLPSVTSATKTVSISFQGDFKLKPPPWAMLQGGRGMRLPFGSLKFRHERMSTV